MRGCRSRERVRNAPCEKCALPIKHACVGDVSATCCSCVSRGSNCVEMIMRIIPKILIALGFLSLGGCVVAPVGPPAGVYVGPQVVAAPYVAVSPYYYGWYGPHYYYGRRW